MELICLQIDLARQKERVDFVGLVSKGRTVLHVLVGYAVNVGGLLWNRDAGIEQPAALLLGAVGHNLYRAELDDSVALRE